MKVSQPCSILILDILQGTEHLFTPICAAEYWSKTTGMAMYSSVMRGKFAVLLHDILIIVKTSPLRQDSRGACSTQRKVSRLLSLGSENSAMSDQTPLKSMERVWNSPDRSRMAQYLFIFFVEILHCLNVEKLSAQPRSNSDFYVVRFSSNAATSW